MSQRKMRLDFFPVDTGHFRERAVRLVRGAFPADKQLEIWAILLALFDQIYGIQGYYAAWKEEDQILFAQDYNSIDRAYVSEVVRRAVEHKIFAGDKLEQWDILTSEEHLLNFLHVGKRREIGKLIRPYLVINDVTRPRLISVADRVVFVDENEESVNMSDVFDIQFPHRIGEEKESIGDSAKVSVHGSNGKGKGLEPVPDLDDEQQEFLRDFQTMYGTVFPHAEKQIVSVRDLFHYAGQVIESLGLEKATPPRFLRMMLETFALLKKKDGGKTGYWRKMPLTPQRLWQHRDEVFEHAKDKWNDSQQSRRYHDLLANLKGESK